MSRRTLFFSCVLMLASAAQSRAGKFEIDVTVYKGDPKGNREAGTMRLISAPQMVTRSGEEGTVAIGGQILLGKQAVPVGQHVSITATDLGKGAIQVKLVFKNNKVIGPAAAPQVTIESDNAATTIKSGGRIRLELGHDPKDKTWVEVTIREAKR